MRAKFAALSADHLEHLDQAGVDALAAAGTVAVLLPGAWYYLRETQKPPIEMLRAAGVPMAVASDLNPGTSPLASLRLMLNMGCVLFGLTPEESLAGTTRRARGRLAWRIELGTLIPWARRPIFSSGTSATRRSFCRRVRHPTASAAGFSRGRRADAARPAHACRRHGLEQTLPDLRLLTVKWLAFCFWNCRISNGSHLALPPRSRRGLRIFQLGTRLNFPPIHAKMGGLADFYPPTWSRTMRLADAGKTAVDPHCC